MLRKDGAGEWILVDDGYIVHGGDACDKGKKKKKNMKKTMRSLWKRVLFISSSLKAIVGV